ncbi:MAG: hypothetical protein LBS08_03270 [Candidatus Symbiothrix sp.]|jgi:hypothetical protein|nr:hypothetical protein [Candidatus Symbiothrix sp.]
MKKEFGKWLMDIAKYIVTAVVLSSFFDGFSDTIVLYASAVGFAVLLLVVGVIFQREEVKVKRRK